MKSPEIGIIMKTYLSDGELREVERIAAKSQSGSYSEKELNFIIAMAGRTCKMPLKPPPPGIEVLIRSEEGKFSIVSINSNKHLNN
jgi:hypothetical protein